VDKFVHILSLWIYWYSENSIKGRNNGCL